MKILNFGSINIDFVYSVPHIVNAGETIPSTLIQKFAGGKGANQSVALAKAGADVWHAGKIGKDGKWLLEKLESHGVKTDLIKTGKETTGQAIIQLTPQGQNSIIISGGENQKITEQEINDSLSKFKKEDFIVLQNEINLTPLIIKKASDKGMKICFNPAPYNDLIKLWPIELVDILIVNKTEAQGLSEITAPFEKTLDKLAEKFPDTDIILTAGEKGAFYGRNKTREYTPATKTKTVDTTAAGDTFLGYYLASQTAGLDVKTSMGRASKAASITVSRQGAMDSIPLLSEI